MMKNMDRFAYMTQTPIPKLMRQLAIPTIISMLITSFYNMADAYFIGKTNTSAQAGVGVAFSAMAIIQAVGFFFGHGSGNYLSRSLGNKDNKRAKEMVSCGVLYGVIAAILIAILGLLWIHPLAQALGATDTNREYAIDYLRWIIPGSIVLIPSLVINNQLRFQGSAIYAMVGIVSGAIINVILDPILIFGFYWIKPMGVTGAAMATVIGQAVSLILLIVGTYQGENIRISLRGATFSKYYFVEIARGGFPSLCRQGIASIAAISMNHVAGYYSDAAIAAMSVVSRMSMFINAALIGFGQGFQPICAFNYGAKRFDRVKESFWFSLKVGMIWLLLISIGVYIYAPSLLSFFTKNDQEVIRIGAQTLRYQSILFPLNVWTILTNMMLQSVGKMASASLVAIARQGLFFIPFLFLLNAVAGLFGIQITQSIADLCSLLLAIPLSLRFLKKMAIYNYRDTINIY